MEKKIFFVIFGILFFIILFIFSSGSFLITTFNNSLTSESLTFTKDQNITRYLDIPRYSNVTSAYLNLSVHDIYINQTDGFSTISLGFSTSPFGITNNGTNLFIPSASNNFLYITSLNGTNLTGGFSLVPTGSKLVNPITSNGTDLWFVCYINKFTYHTLLDGTNITDGFSNSPTVYFGITTNGTDLWLVDYASSQVDHKLLNGTDLGDGFDTSPISRYDQPRDITNNGTDFWIVHDHSDDLFFYNFNKSGNNLSEGFSAYSIGSSNPQGITTTNGTDFWITDGVKKFVFHVVRSYPTNPYLEIGTPDGTREWNYIGEFNQINNKTEDLTSSLNTALNSGACDCTGCSLNGNNCTIPFLFHSDTVGKIEYSDIDINYHDIKNPDLTIVSPLNQTYSTSTIDFNVTVIEDIEIDTCLYSLNAGLNNFTMTAFNTTYYNATNSTMLEGSQTATFYCNDTSNNLNDTETITFTVSIIDSTNPLLTIRSPTNTTYSVSTIDFNITANENLSYCNFTFGGGYYVMSEFNATYFNYTNSSVLDGSWTAYFSCNDTSNNWNNTKVTFAVDKTYPQINVTYPQNITYSSIQTELNYTYIESNPDSCWWTNNSGITNYSIICGNNVTGGKNGTFFEGWEGGNINSNWTVYGSPGDYNRTNITTSFTPNSGTYHLTMDSSSDTHYELNEITTTYDFSGASYINLTFYWKEFSDESDTCPNSWTGHTNGDCVSYTCDGTTWYKVVDLTGGSSTYTRESVMISKCGNSSFAIKFQQYDNYKLTTDGIALDDININYYSISSLEGSNTWTIYINDTAGNLNSTSVTFVVTIDTTPPSLSITSPSINNTNTTNNQIEINYTVSDNIGLDSCWWTNNTGITNHTLTCGNNITGETWAEGLNTIKIYANDTAGNLNGTEIITFRVDTTAPTSSASATSPPNGASYTFNTWTNDSVKVTITGSDLGVGFDNTVYPKYCTDTSNTCTPNTYIGSGVTISTEGTSYIRYYTEDYIGNTETTQSKTIKIDKTYPQINVTYPKNITYSSIQTELNYTYTETNCNKVWYSTDGGTTNYSKIDCGTNWTIGNNSKFFDGGEDWTHDTNCPSDSEWDTCNNGDGFVQSTATKHGASSASGGTYWIMAWDLDKYTTYLTEGQDLSECSKAYLNISVNLGNSLETGEQMEINVSNATDTIEIYDSADWNEEDEAWHHHSFKVSDNITLDSNFEVKISGKPTFTYDNHEWHAIDDFHIICENTTISTEGSNTWTIYINDLAGNENSSSVIFIVDTTSPQMTVYSPENTTYSRQNITINFTADSYDTLWFYNGTGNTTYDGSFLEQNFSDGSYTFIFYANDSIGNLNDTETITFTIDTTYPEVNITYPINTTYTTSTHDLNYTYTESNCDKVWYYNGTDNSSTVSCGTNWTTIIANECSNTWRLYINDTAGNLNDTEMITFSVDTIYPQITISYPANTTYNVNVSNINYTYTEINCNSIWYSNNGGITNSSPVTCGNNFTNVISTEGSNTWTIYINDTVNNENSTSMTFVKDITNPQLSITSPSINNTNTTNNQIEINYTVSDNIGLDSCWWTNNTGITNHTLTCGNNITGETWAEGLNTIKIYANDTAGNLNGTEIITFRVDTTAPTLSIVYPEDLATYGDQTLDLNYTISDSGVGLDTCWYKNDTDAVNITLTCGTNTTITQTDGTHTIYMWANDTLGNEASDSHTYTISTTAPAITLKYPTNNTYLNITTIWFNYTSIDANGVDTCELWGDWTGIWHKNLTNTHGGDTSVDINEGNFTQTIAEGSHIWNIRCNDTGGAVGFYVSNWTFTIDTTNPLISYGNGTASDETNTTATNIYINVSVTEINEDTITFILHNSTNSYDSFSSTESTRIVNFTSVIDGVYTYNVTINDSVGNTNTTTTRTIRLDDTAPSITIDIPLAQNYKNNNSVELNYTATDNVVGLNECWYYVQNSTGDTAVTTTTLSTCQNTTFKLPGGDIDYTVYLLAKDLLANIQSASVTFGIRTESPVVVLTTPNDTHTNTVINNYFNFTVTTNADSIDTCELWGNWSGWHLNQTLTSVSYDGSNNNFTAISLTEGEYYYNVFCNDSLNNNGWALNNNTYIVDLTKPVPNITTITTTAGSQTINFNTTITDLYQTTITCKYSIYDSTGTIDGISENISFNCNTKTSATVTAFATYNLTVWAEDKATNENFTTKSFTTTTAPVTPPTGSGTPTIIYVEGGNWTLQTEGGAESYYLVMSPGTYRDKTLVFENLGEEDRTISLSCKEEVSGNLSICNYVEFENTTFILKAFKEIKTGMGFSVILPEEIEGGFYVSKVRAIDDLGNLASISLLVDVETRNPIKIIPLKLISKFRLWGYGFYYLFAFFLLWVIFGIVGYYLGIKHLPYGAVWSILTGFVLSIIIIMIF